MENSEFDCLAVTAVTISALPKTAVGKVVALATVVLNDQIIIREICVCNGPNGYYVSYPKEMRDDIPRSIVFPVTRQLREHIENCVLEKFSTHVDGEIKKARDHANYALCHTTDYNNGETLPDTAIIRIGDEEYCMELFNDIKAKYLDKLQTNGEQYISFVDSNGWRQIYAVKTSKS